MFQFIKKTFKSFFDKKTIEFNEVIKDDILGLEYTGKINYKTGNIHIKLPVSPKKNYETSFNFITNTLTYFIPHNLSGEVIISEIEVFTYNSDLYEKINDNISKYINISTSKPQDNNIFKICLYSNLPKNSEIRVVLDEVKTIQMNW
jgi:hypothetical protein